MLLFFGLAIFGGGGGAGVSFSFCSGRSVGFFNWAFLVFLEKESKKRRRKQPGKLMAKSHSQPVSLPGAWCPALNEPPWGGATFGPPTITHPIAHCKKT